MGGLTTQPDLIDVSEVEPSTSEDEPELPEAPPSMAHFWRVTVARWPIDRRQRWGDRANTLQDAGFSWKDAERVAFEEIMADLVST